MLENMKVFFTPGDRVYIKHDLPNKPIMLVKGKETRAIRGEDTSHFLGIRCFWFTTEGQYQEQIYSTKDLMHVALDKRYSNDCPDCGFPSSNYTCSKHIDRSQDTETKEEREAKFNYYKSNPLGCVPYTK